MDDAALAVLEYGKIKQILARRLRTAPGARALAALRPATEPRRVAELQAQTTEMRAAFGRDGPGLGAVADAPVLLERAQRDGLLEPAELRDLAATIRAADATRAVILEAAGEPPPGRPAREGPPLPHLAALARRLPRIPSLAGAIEDSIEPDGRVADDASPELSDLRWQLRFLEDDIRRAIGRLLARPEVARVLQNPRPTVRKDRFVLAVHADQRHVVPGVVLDRSKTGVTVYVEPHDVVAMGNDLADLRAAERREVTRILRELTRLCLAERAELEAMADVLGEIDLVAARARWAVEDGLVAPRIEPAGGGALELRGALHPLLLEQAREDRLPDGEVTPIDVRLGEDFDVLLVTGPNTGGKTVALKTAGLLAAMAQSGMHLPVAEGSRLPVYERIFTDIGDEQSIEQSLSTFSSHVARLVPILEDAGPRDLVLIDELGSGTDPSEGTALGIAIVEAVLARGTRALVTTHLGRLKDLAYRVRRLENAACEFDPRSLRPTYRVIIGQAGTSHAFEVSRRLGMPAGVLARAEELGRDPDRDRHVEADEIAALRLQAEERLAEADRARAAALARAAEAEAARDRLCRREEHLDEEADRELAAHLAPLAREVDRACTELAKAPPPFGPQALALNARVVELLERTPFGERRRAFARRLKQGQTVYVIPLGRRGTVTRINRSREALTLDVDGLRTQVAFRDVSWIDPSTA